VRAGDTDEQPADGRVRDDLLPRLDRHTGFSSGDELRIVRINRRQGLRHRQALRPKRRHVGRVVARDEHDPAAFDRGAVRRAAGGVTAAHHRAGVVR
jgi:hypothetical protein